MIFIINLLVATIMTIIGFFVLFTAMRSEGGLKRFGQYLAAWTFFLAGIIVLGGLIALIFGMTNPMSHMFEHMQTMEGIEKEQLEMLRELRREGNER